MDNQNELIKSKLVLLLIFFASILKDVTTGTLSSVWVVLIGAIIIGLSFSAMFLHDRKGSDILNDR